MAFAIGTESVIALSANEDFSGFVGLVWIGEEGEGAEQGYAKAQYEDFVLDMVESEPYPPKVVQLVQELHCQDEGHGLVNGG